MPEPSSPSAACRRGQEGITLLDLAVTLVVLAIAATFTLSSAVRTLETYRRSLAARQVLSEIRRVQSLAVANADVYGLQWGGAPAVHLLPSHYRIARDTTGECDYPSPIDPVDGEDVVTGWIDLGRDYPEVVIRSIRDDDDRAVATLAFDALGASVGTCGPVSFPLVLVVEDRSGSTEEIEITRSGMARIL
jgi:type II secretory pathway pseudopilin PulG